MAKKKCSAIIQIIIIVIIAFLPTNAIMAFSSTKDILFAGFFCLMVYFTTQIADDEYYLKRKKSWILTIIGIFGVLIFRNQGIYVIVLGLICGIILLKGQRKRIVLLLLTSVILFSAYSGPITTLLHGVKSESQVQEMLSVPIMQLSRAVVYGSDSLTESEIQLITEYIPNAQKYTIGENTGISDSFKSSFNSERFKKNPTEFVNLWIRVGIKAPMAYVDAFARLSIDLWYPDMDYRDYEAYHPYWEYENTPQNNPSWIIIERHTPKVLQWLADYYKDLTYNNSYQKIPIISMLYSGGFFVWLMWVYIAWCIYKKEYKMLFPVSFIVVYWLTMLIGPVVLYRYLYAVIMSVLVLICTMMTKNKFYGALTDKCR